MSYKISTIFSNKFDTNLQTQYITFWYTWEGMFVLPTPTISACITHVGNDERKWRRRTWSSVSTKETETEKKKKIFVYDISHPCVYKGNYWSDSIQIYTIVQLSPSKSCTIMASWPFPQVSFWISLILSLSWRSKTSWPQKIKHISWLNKVVK